MLLKRLESINIVWISRDKVQNRDDNLGLHNLNKRLLLLYWILNIKEVSTLIGTPIQNLKRAHYHQEGWFARRKAACL